MTARRFQILIALTLLGTACTREFAEPQGGTVRDEVEISVSLPDAAVRTCLGQRGENSYQTLWSEGDMLSLNGLSSVALSSEDAGRNTASFKFKGNITYPYNLLYPATEQASVVSFPAVQNYYEATFDPLAVPMYSASINFENASLSHLSSLLKFTFTSQEPVNLSLVQVTAMGGEHLSGDFNMVTDADGLFTGEMTPGDGSVSSSLSFGEQGFTLSSEPKSFYMSVPHGTYSKGFTVLVITDDDKVMTLKFYTAAGEQEIEPSKVIEFETKEFSGEESVLLIRNEADLQALETSQEGHSEAVIIADLDFTGKEWTPITTMSINLDGAGHRIKGLAGPLCKTLTGSVRTLTIEAAINMTQGTGAAAFAETVDHENALLEDCVSAGIISMSASGSNVGGLVAEMKKGTLRRCTNRASVTASKVESVGGCVGANKSGSCLLSVVNDGMVNVTGAKYTGGVVGSNTCSDLDGEMVANTAESSLTYTVSSDIASPAVGGVVGFNNVPSAILKSVVNKADLNIVFPAAVSANTDIKFGGVVGYMYYNAGSYDDTMILNCEKCVNDGDITITGKMASSTAKMQNGVQVGGIMGRAQITSGQTTNKVVLSACVNNGNISINEANGSTYSFIGGIIGVHSVSMNEVTGCSNTGDVVLNGNVDTFASLGGITGSVYRNAASTSTYSLCNNSGKIAVNDETSSLAVAAGGIIGNASGISDKVMTLNMNQCTNNGVIDRTTQTPGIKNPICDSYGGGIVGIIGRRHVSTAEGYVNVVISECSNTAQIIFNQFTGFDSMTEASTDHSFTGGIVGCSVANAGSVRIEACTNSGDIMSTSGQHGGILGFAFAGTTVAGVRNPDGTIKYTVNTGNICDFDQYNSTGSGNCIAGGIVGYLKSQKTYKNSIEYAWNSGNVYGSLNNATVNAGGIVGKNQVSSGVRYCKNSGKVRNYKNAACGAISGAEVSVPVEYCGVGGRVYRAAGWITLDEGVTYPFQNYIYCNNVLMDPNMAPLPAYPENVCYKGCCFWDGTSELPWEKADWVEPQE